MNVHPNYGDGKDGQWGRSGNHSPWRPDFCPFSYFLERFLTCFLTSIHHSFFPNFSLYTGSSFSFIYTDSEKRTKCFNKCLFGRFGSIWTLLRRGSGFCIFGTIYCFLFFFCLSHSKVVFGLLRMI